MKTQKTKKSFKKKALLSSLSMLMVATVAVGSATFAWFTQSPTATASGLVMKATASNGLKIISQSQKAANDGSDFASTTYLNYDKATGASSTEAVLLNPASYTFDVSKSTMNTTGYKTTAAADTAADALDTAAVDTAVAAYTGTKDVYAEEVYCKLVGAASADTTTTLKLASIAIDTNDVALKNSLRVLVTYNGTIKGAYALSAIPSETSLNDTIAASTAESDGKGYANADKKTVSFNAYTSVSDLELGTLKQDGTDAVKVYIYLDGEDSNCKSQNINVTDIVNSITLNLAIPTNS